MRLDSPNDPEGKLPVPEQHDKGPIERDDGFLPFPIVGIGASAGGFEAYQQLLAHLPADCDMAIVLIQHLDPHHESRMSELLAHSAKMPVTDAAQGMAVEPNHIYVIPPNTNLGIVHGILQLTPRVEGHVPHLPIDYFFRTLAEDQKTRAVGVVLSGTGSDGTQGLCEIKAVGGLTFVQDESSAKFSGMPRSAIGNGGADLVLPPDQIAQRLCELRTHPYLIPTQPAPLPQASDESQYQRILARVRAISGVDFSLYRDSTIKRRILRRMALHTQDSLDGYVQRLDDEAEARALYYDLLINVTSFFRDPALFDALKQVVYPAVMKDKLPMEPVRIWVPGCSTGQEAYSIAMSLIEYFDDKPTRPPLQIFATDISDTTTLDKARAGTYPDNIEAEISVERLRRFFQKEDHTYRIQKSIRDMCVFARQNLASDPPFSHVDLISCRNVLIYLATVLQRRVLPTFHYALNSPGFIVLGTSESVGENTDLFDLIDRTNKIYAKKSAVARPPMHFLPEDFRGTAPLPGRGSGWPPATAADYQREADRMLLGRFAPPAVLVDDNLDIVQFRGRTSAYLEAPPGDPTNNLLKMAREGLFLELRSAIDEARQNHQPVRRERLSVRANGGKHEVNIEVAPIRPANVQASCFLVLFEEAGAANDNSPVASERPFENADEREVQQLQRELTATKEFLHSLLEQQDAVNEELRSANEEILSSNEELQSTNEELQTAKEELQSTNEELLTVNEQLQNRNVELSQANNDLSNLLNSIAIPVLMVGPDLRIRRFTAAARRAMNVLANDIGRPIGDLKINIDVADLDDLIHEVIDRIGVREREVQDRDGRWHTLRIHPYRTADNQIDGAVILMIDIDQLKHSVEALRESEARFRVMADSAPVLIWLNGPDACEFVNQAYIHFVGPQYSGDMRNYDWGNYLHPEDRERAVAQYRGMVERRERFEAQFRLRREDGVYRWMKSVGVPRLADNGELLGYVGSSVDVTDLKLAEDSMAQRVEDLKEADRHKNEFLALLAHELRNPLAPIANAVEILRAIGSSDPRFHTSRDIIAREIEHMSRMLDDLLDLNRLNLNRLVLQSEPLKAADIVGEARATSQPVLDMKRHRLEVNLPAEDLWIHGDRVRLCQVLANLLINAAKYTDAGGRIVLTAERDGNSVAFRVADNGIGMTKELLDHIFEMFQQGEGSGAEGGLGIGLTLVRSLVALHGGSVEAASDGLRQGSRFTVRLPLIAAPAARDGPAPPETNAAATEPKDFLVVDDNKLQASSLAMLLESFGHRVKTANDAESALAVLQDFVPEFALIDLGLPAELDGCNLARRIRAEPRFAQTVLIAQTGWGRDEDRQRSRAAGFDYHVVKPIDHQRLQRIIAGHESSKRSSHETG